jgi:hypothetical protein
MFANEIYVTNTSNCLSLAQRLLHPKIVRAIAEDVAYPATVKCAISTGRSNLNIPNIKFPAQFCR